MNLAPILAFDYPITKPFPRNWCHGLLAFGVLSTSAFAAVNVFLVGYDVVNITTNDHNFNTTKGGILPWSTDSNLGCEPHQFQLGDTFRTNISAFSYTIADVQPADFATPSAIQGGVSYSNNVLNDCDVVRYEIVVKPGDLSIAATASIQCPQPLGLRAVTTWSYTNHPVLLGISTSLFPEKSLARAITDAMLNISAEVYWDIADGAYTTNDGTVPPQKIYMVFASGYPKCDPDPPSFCRVPSFETYTAVGNTELNLTSDASSIKASEGNLYNLINILYAAVRLDLGHWTADNIFANTTSFKSVIQPSTLTPNMPPGNNSIAFRIAATSKGMAYVNSTTPPSPDTPTEGAVIQIPYTCNVMRRKAPGSFIVSVLSATVSMFLATWGPLVFFLSTIARRKPGANICELHTLTSNVSNLEDGHDVKSIPLLYRRTTDQ